MTSHSRRGWRKGHAHHPCVTLPLADHTAECPIDRSPNRSGLVGTMVLVSPVVEASWVAEAEMEMEGGEEAEAEAKAKPEAEAEAKTERELRQGLARLKRQRFARRRPSATEWICRRPHDIVRGG